MCFKQKLKITLMYTILLLLLTGCSGSLPSKGQIKKDISTQPITKANGRQLWVQDLKKLDVIKKQDDSKNSGYGLVQCKVHFVDQFAQADVVAPIDVLYVYVKNVGWQYSGIYFTDETKNVYTPLKLFTWDEITKSLHDAPLGYVLEEPNHVSNGETYQHSISGMVAPDVITSVELLNSTYNKEDNSYSIRAQITSATQYMNLVGEYEGKVYHDFPGYVFNEPLVPVTQYPTYDLPNKLEGSFEVEGYPTAFRYTVETTQTSGEYRTGILTFVIDDTYNEPITGSYNVNLKYDNQNGKLKVTAGNWIKHPENTERYDIEYMYNGAKNYFTGQLKTSSEGVPCGTCFVTK